MHLTTTTLQPHIVFLLLWSCFALVQLEEEQQQQAKKLDPVAIALDDFNGQLLQQLEREHVGQNVLFSSLSVSTVLTLLMSGSAGSTYTQFYNALGYGTHNFSNENGAIYESYHQLLTNQLSREKTMPNILQMANGMAIQTGHPILESFHKTVVEKFGSEVFTEDFSTSAGMRKTVSDLNEWVSKQTERKISKFISEKEFSSNTVLVLLNALYFKGAWAYHFSENETKMAQFHLGSNQSANVPFMHCILQLNYGQFNDGQLVELPYKHEHFGMLLFLPAANQSNVPIGSLFNGTAHHPSLAKRIAQFEERDVELYMPRFKITSSYLLNEPLQKLGVVAPFQADVADFSKTDGTRQLVLNKVMHQAVIEVNEQGSEAAGSTFAQDVAIHYTGPLVFLRLDRPFVFFIFDKRNQLPLFSGIVNKPE